MSIEHRISYYALAALMMFDGVGLAFLTATARPEQLNWHPFLAYAACFLISVAFVSMSAFLWWRASK